MKKNGDNIINFYEHESIKKYITSYRNPHFKDTQMSIPARMGIIAPSGSGKSQFVLNYIAKCSDTFGHIVIVCKAMEPLYELLRDKLGSKAVTFYLKLTDLPAPNDLNMGNKQVLLIFDDQNVEKKQEKIEEYFLRGRKVGAGVTMMYLAQNFFGIPTLIRRQFNYVIILKLSGSKDLKAIITNYSLGLDANEIVKICKDATKDKLNFFKIDLETRFANRTYSHNFTGFYKISDEIDDDEI
jgi:hypothetical protein